MSKLELVVPRKKPYKFTHITATDKAATGLGDEPDTFTGNPYSWYNAFYTYKDAKGFVLQYLEEIDFPKVDLDVVKEISMYEFIPMGWNFKMLSNGVEVPDLYVNKSMEKLRKLISAEKDRQAAVLAGGSEATVDMSDPLVIRENMTRPELLAIEKRKVISRLQKQVGDMDDAWSFSAWVNNVSLPTAGQDSTALMDCVIENVTDWYLKLRPVAYKAPDKKLKAKLIKRVELLENILTTAYAMNGVPNVDLKAIWQNASIAKPVKNADGKKPRKVRAKKAKTPEQLTKKIKFLAATEDDKYKSVDPKTIIGALQLYTFNVKTRMAALYETQDGQVLTVKGTTILNYDEKKSYQKKVRKPEEFLKEIMVSGKPSSRKLLEKIRAVGKPLNGRLSADVLLLKVYK